MQQRPGHLLPAPALLPTPRVRKRSAQGLDPIDESAPTDAALALGLGSGTAPGGGGVGLGLGLGIGLGVDDGRAAKRVRADVDVEPAFASLSLTSATAPTPAALPSVPRARTHLARDPLYAPPRPPPPPPPLPGLVPVPVRPLLPPVTPPLQQGEASSTAPPLIRTHRPTPTPSPPTAYAQDCRMSSSYDLNPHVVYVASLDDSDDDEEPVPLAPDDHGSGRLELHPALLAATAKPPSPLPPELVVPRADEMGLVLYRPLKFGLEDEQTHSDEYKEFQRRAAEEERRYDSGPGDGMRDSGPGDGMRDSGLGAGNAAGDGDGDGDGVMAEDDDVEMDAMDVDG